MVEPLLAPERIVAATYVHNQKYYNKPGRRPAGRLRNKRRSAYSSYRTAAEELAELVNAAACVKFEAYILGRMFQAFDEEEESAYSQLYLVRQTKRLVDAYNDMLERTTAADWFLTAGTQRLFDQVADGFDWLGISRGSDGAMLLDEERCAQALDDRLNRGNRSAAGPFGSTEWLSRLAEPFDRTAPYDLFNASKSELRVPILYRPNFRVYMQLPSVGVLLDTLL